MLKIGGIYNTFLSNVYLIILGEEGTIVYYYFINDSINEISNSTINSLISSYINIEKFDAIDLSISLKLGLGDVGYIGNLTATNMKRLTDAFKETDLYKKVVQNKEDVCKRWQN